MAVDNVAFKLPAEAQALSQKRSIRLALLYLVLSFLVAWVFWFLSWLYTKGLLVQLPLVPVLIVGSFGPFVGAESFPMQDEPEGGGLFPIQDEPEGIRHAEDG